MNAHIMARILKIEWTSEKNVFLGGMFIKYINFLSIGLGEKSLVHIFNPPLSPGKSKLTASIDSLSLISLYSVQFFQLNAMT